MQNKTKNSIFAIMFLTGIIAPLLSLACSFPITITTISATNITQTSATLTGQIFLCGTLDKATVWFQYGPTTSYGQTTSEQKSYGGSFTADISGLTSCANYHFRAVARDTAGSISYGQDMAFTTKCNTVLPTVDIKANNSDGPVSIAYNSSATLSWASTNATSCQAYGNWSGTKATSGSESTGNLNYSNTYTISCAGTGGTATDSVLVNVAQNRPPVANAGPDKEVTELQSIVLEGSGTDPDNDTLTYSWSCGGGTLSNPNIAQPNFSAPSVVVDMNYVCILTVKDPYNLTGFDSMNVKVKSIPQVLPTVDLKANNSDGPVSVAYNSTATLSWTSTNATSCQAYGNWSGTKYTSGSESTGALTYSNVYTISCTGTGGTATDSVTVNVAQNRPPAANAGPDKEVTELQSIILEGSGTDPDNDSLTYSWTCGGGTLSNPNIAQPNFSAPSVVVDMNYVCILTVKDPYNLTGFDSMNVKVKNQGSCNFTVSLQASPSIGCDSLQNISLSAQITPTDYDYSYDYGSTTWSFDCKNDGSWDKIDTNNSNFYTASNVCSYSSPGTYTAKVKAQRDGFSAENTASINITSCYTPLPTVDIKANGYDGAISVAYNSLVNLSWTSTNATSCYASNGWTGSKATSGTESIGSAVLSRTYTIVCTGNNGSASDSVIVNVTPISQGNLTIEKLVRNTSDGTSWLDSVPADPGEMLSFSIKITADGSAVQDVILKDALPSRLIFRDNLKIDGVYQSCDLITGLNLGTFNAYQSKTITFDAEVANKDMFSVGETSLINTALVYSTSASSSDTARVVVKKESPTDISTGLTNNIFFDSFFLPLAIASFLVWLFRAKIFQFEEWLDTRNKKYRRFKAAKILQFKRAKIKAQEYVGKLKLV